MNIYNNLINLTNKILTNLINRKLVLYCYNTKAAVIIYYNMYNKVLEQRQP